MERFGGDLRSERERRNISLETIGAMTKVSPHYLRALEADEYAVLPHGVFRKGILRGYLGAVGLEEMPWMQRFETILDATGNGVCTSGDLTQYLEGVSRSYPSRQSMQGMRWIGATVMVLAVALLGWTVWYFVLHGRVVLSSFLRN